MYIISIINKEILQGIRDIKTTLIMILMPTILTILLAIVFKDEFSNDLKIPQISVSILNTNTIDESYINNLITILEEAKIEVKTINDINVFNSEKEILIKGASNNDFSLFYTPKNNLAGRIVSNLLNNFFYKIEANKQSVDFNYNKPFDYVELQASTNSTSINSLNYYGISMVVLTLMFSSVTGAYKVIKERDNKTLVKLLSIPVSFKNVLLGKLLGSMFITLLQIGTVLLMSKFFIGVNWGHNNFFIILMLLSIASLSISLGIFIGNFLKDNKSCWMVLLSIIMICGLLGGAFIPLHYIKSKFFYILSCLSPIKYTLSAIFNSIYLADNSTIVLTSCLFIVISFILLQLSALKMEENI